MFDFNILLTWEKFIDTWKNILSKYIIDLEYNGLYYMGDEWTQMVNNFDSIKYINNNTLNYNDIKDYRNFLLLLNKLESINIILSNTTNVLLSNNITKHINKIEYDKLMLDLFDKKKESFSFMSYIIDNTDEYIDTVVNNDNITDIISLYETEYLYNDITIEIYLNILKKYKKTEYIESYKNIIFGSYILNDNIIDISNSQYINYLIEPFINNNNKKDKIIDISIDSKQDIEYNILPLISKIDAVKYGPLSNNNTGINISMINRFNTIKLLYNNLNNVKNSEINSILSTLPIYTGSSIKKIKPVHYKEGDEWYPMKGVDYKTYKYNNILEDIIFSNMKIKEDTYNKKYQSIISTDILNNNVNISISELYYNELSKFLDKKGASDIIKKEMFLLQFFNINKNIEYVKRRDFDNVEIIPVSKMVHFFNLT
jgi:hypothetical protein